MNEIEKIEKVLICIIVVVVALLLVGCGVEDQAGSYLSCVNNCKTMPGGNAATCQSLCLQ